MILTYRVHILEPWQPCLQWRCGIPLLFRIPKAWLRALQCGDWSSQRLLVHCLDCDPAELLAYPRSTQNGLEKVPADIHCAHCMYWNDESACFCWVLFDICSFPGTRCFTSRVGCAGTYFPCKHQFHGSGKEANR